MRQKIKDEELLSKIQHKLRALRIEKSLTLEEVYNDTGIHLARIESGKLNLSISTLNALCQYYGINLKDFFQHF